MDQCKNGGWEEGRSNRRTQRRKATREKKGGGKSECPNDTHTNSSALSLLAHPNLDRPLSLRPSPLQVKASVTKGKKRLDQLYILHGAGKRRTL
jgi:hypothetical protein